MLIIPAIDLREGKCVRLVQGEAHNQIIFSENTAQVAKNWNLCGAKRLHVVDLDGAFIGYPQNTAQFKIIRENFEGIIEFGGGIRTQKDIENLINLGADKIILGTVAYESDEFLSKCIEKYKNKIIVGIDARNGYAAIKGWVETTKLKADILARKMESMGVEEIIFTDILRDGMMKGPNIQSLEHIAKTVKIPVIASGGISSNKDVENIVNLKCANVTGMIIGKALYTKDIDLKEVIKCWQKE